MTASAVPHGPWLRAWLEFGIRMLMRPEWGLKCSGMCLYTRPASTKSG